MAERVYDPSLIGMVVEFRHIVSGLTSIALVKEIVDHPGFNYYLGECLDHDYKAVIGKELSWDLYHFEIVNIGVNF